MKLLKLFIVALSLSVFACKKDKNDPQPPTITGLSASTGNVNTSIIITGTNFSTTPASNTVKFGDVVATVDAATATQLTVKVPNGSTKGKVSVQVGTFTAATSASEFQTTSFIDTRDSQEYGQAWVGSQLWMTKNLNYDATSGDYCYNDDAAKCTAYGRLYEWTPALTACPNGWRLPTETDFNTLITNLGGATSAKTALVGTSSSSGLSVLYSGTKGASGYGNEGERTLLWSSIELNSTQAKALDVNANVADITIGAPLKTNGYCIRCIKN